MRSRLPHRRALVGFMGALAAIGIAGCAAQNESADEPGPEGPTAESSATTTSTTADKTNRGVSISSIEAPVGDQVVLHTRPTLSEQGPEPCRGELEAEITRVPHAINVALTVSTRAAPPFHGCELVSRTVTITISDIPAELRIRDHVGGRFSFVDGKLQNCPAGPMICNNDPASCENRTLHDAIANEDVPAHFYMPTTRCDAPFAVVDVDYGAGACPQTGEPGNNPCAGQRLHRMYWRIAEDTWVLIGYDDRTGCGAIDELADDFPRDLCEDLDALA